MAEVNLPANSTKLSEEKPKGEKVIQGQVVVQKKSEASKIAKDFFSEDAKNVSNYILKDILVPALKKLLEDVVTNGINIVLWGDSKPRNGSSRTNVSRVSYRDYYDKPTISYSRSSYGYDTDDIIFQTKEDAEEVLDAMDDAIARYRIVSVGDLHDFVGERGTHTDYKYGWTNLRGARIVRTRRGWMLDLPKAMPID